MVQRLAAMGGAYGNLAALAGDRSGSERLDRAAMARVGAVAVALGLVTADELDAALALLDPGFPFFAALRHADRLHLHVKVADVAALSQLRPRHDVAPADWLRAAHDHHRGDAA